jgi:peptide/nickel transport system permease protein
VVPEAVASVEQVARGAKNTAGGLARPLRGLRRDPILRLIVHRLLTAVPLVIVVSSLTFVLVSVTPGDAASQILGTTATPQEYKQLRDSLGLDHPVYVQYWHWLRHALTGDLGTSIFSSQPVTQAIGQRLPVTLSLIAGALIVSIVIGIGLGVLSSLIRGPVGRAVDTFALIGFALPAFWVGAELIALFAVKVNWFPPTGYVPFAQSPIDWLRSLVLPVLALSLYGVAATAKATREAMLDVLASEHIRMARANGIRPRSIYFRHALRNAGMRVLTVLGVVAVGLLGGTVLIENVFSLPGLGSYVVSASLDHDLPVVEGVAVTFTLLVVATNLVIDIAYAALNPRVRVQ